MLRCCYTGKKTIKDPPSFYGEKKKKKKEKCKKDNLWGGFFVFLGGGGELILFLTKTCFLFCSSFFRQTLKVVVSIFAEQKT